MAGLIHGLGLLAVTVMVLTGAVLFFGLPEDGRRPSLFTNLAEEVHKFFSTLIWIYWGAHGALAVLHQIVAKDGSLSRMFRLNS